MKYTEQEISSMFRRNFKDQFKAFSDNRQWDYDTYCKIEDVLTDYFYCNDKNTIQSMKERLTK